MEMIKALGAEGPFVFPESKDRKKKIQERENVAFERAEAAKILDKWLFSLYSKRIQG